MGNITVNDKLENRYPENEILTDACGMPSVMVYVPRFNLSDVIDGASDVPHPAFVVGGRVLSGIYISKFQNIVVDGLAMRTIQKTTAASVRANTARMIFNVSGIFSRSTVTT